MEAYLTDIFNLPRPLALARAAVLAEMLQLQSFGVKGLETPDQISSKVKGKEKIYEAAEKGEISNIMVVTGGPQNIVILSIGKDAYEAWNRDFVDKRTVPNTLSLANPNANSIDIYFKLPKSVFFGEMLDINGYDIHYIPQDMVTPFFGSIDPDSGERYEIIGGIENDDIALYAMPHSLIAWLRYHENNVKENLNMNIIEKALDCSNLQTIKSGKLIGKGGEGSVYRYCIEDELKYNNICSFAVKTQECEKADDLKTLIDEAKISNKLNKSKMAPRAYGVRRCGTKCLTLMDLVEGKTLYKVLKERNFKGHLIDLLFSAIANMHHESFSGHGDLNPGNIFYQNNHIVFIDINKEVKNRPAAYDYITLAYYLPVFYDSMNYNEFVRFVEILIQRIQEIYDSGDKNSQILETINLLRELTKGPTTIRILQIFKDLRGLAYDFFGFNFS